MRISDWSSDVCSSDLIRSRLQGCKPRQRKHQRCRCSERPRPATFERPAAPARADFEGRPERTERTPERPARAPRPRGAPEAGMETYRIAVGSAHDVKPGKIVGASAHEAGLDSQNIGRREKERPVGAEWVNTSDFRGCPDQ